jgi:SWI/SNF-related matrix-associated actin-dependent regulator of chromatin subfamily A member 5
MCFFNIFEQVVTTCDMAVGSTMKHSLTRQWWRTVTLDEGHKIKNEGTDVSEACRKIRATTRVLLTGTPMQNNLHELWAMLNFLLPDIFVASAPFDSCFDLTKGVSGAAIARAAGAVGGGEWRRRAGANMQHKPSPL